MFWFCQRLIKLISIFCFVTIFCSDAICLNEKNVRPIVVVEEDVYSYTPAENGAGPLWNYGSTNIARIGETVFITAQDTIAKAKPDNNTVCRLMWRDENGWRRSSETGFGQTREPCPLIVIPDQKKIFVSDNPTALPHGISGPGPAVPGVLMFPDNKPEQYESYISPKWTTSPVGFNEHSYRSFVADTRSGAWLLIQNIGYTHAALAYFDRKGSQPFQSSISWPVAGELTKDQPLRLCYANVAMINNSVHFVGVSDVREPIAVWHQFKKSLTGSDWDYVARRLYYSWTPDILKKNFSNWIELANREAKAGHVRPGDMWVDPDGKVHLIWEEKAIDDRMRKKFFPGELQRWEINYSVIESGTIVLKKTLLSTNEGDARPIPHWPRFHVTPDNRLFVVYFVDGVDSNGGNVSENRLLEIDDDGNSKGYFSLPMKYPMYRFMTATTRAGSNPSNFIDLLGYRVGSNNTVSYSRIKLQ